MVFAEVIDVEEAANVGGDVDFHGLFGDDGGDAVGAGECRTEFVSGAKLVTWMSVLVNEDEVVYLEGVGLKGLALTDLASLGHGIAGFHPGVVEVLNEGGIWFRRLRFEVFEEARLISMGECKRT